MVFLSKQDEKNKNNVCKIQYLVYNVIHNNNFCEKEGFSMNKTVQKKKTVYKKPSSRPTSVVDNKSLCAALLSAALIYNIVFGCLRNPLNPDNTISWIGFDHPYAFVGWAAITAAALFVNIAFMYRRYNYNGKIGTIALFASPFMAMTIVFCNDWGFEHVIHWIAAITFIVFSGAALLLFFLHNFKKHKNYRIVTFGVAAMLLAMLVILLAVGKSGLLELIPIWLCLVLLFVINFTNFLPVLDEAPEIPEPSRLKKKAASLAGSAGMFGAHDFYMGKNFRGLAHLLLTYVGALLCVDRFIGFGAINNHASDGMLKIFEDAAEQATQLFIAEQPDMKISVEMMFMGNESGKIFLAAGIGCLVASLAWALADRAQIKSGEINTDGDGNPLLK